MLGTLIHLQEMDDLIEAYEVQEKEFMEREQYLLAKLKDCEQVDKVVSTCITEVIHIVKKRYKRKARRKQTIILQHSQTLNPNN
jgi:predicted nucleic acid-binding protein